MVVSYTSRLPQTLCNLARKTDHDCLFQPQAPVIAIFKVNSSEHVFVRAVANTASGRHNRDAHDPKTKFVANDCVPRFVIGSGGQLITLSLPPVHCLASPLANSRRSDYNAD